MLTDGVKSKQVMRHLVKLLIASQSTFCHLFPLLFRQSTRVVESNLRISDSVTSIETFFRSLLVLGPWLSCEALPVFRSVNEPNSLAITDISKSFAANILKELVQWQGTMN